jgi:hypothetical protein
VVHLASFWDRVSGAVGAAANVGLSALSGGSLNVLTSALDWARTTDTVRDAKGFGKAAFNYIDTNNTALRNVPQAVTGQSTRWDGGKLRLKTADDNFFKPTDDLVESNKAAIAGGWEALQGVPVIGDLAAYGVGTVSGAMMQYNDSVLEPIFNYAKATDRHYANLNEQYHNGGASAANAGEQLGTLLGLGGLVGGEDFQKEYENAKRYSIGQSVVAEATGKFRYDEETQRYVSPILDDPEQEQARQEYFSKGWQRFFSGSIDVAANIGLDPANYVLPGVGSAVRKGTTVTADVVETAARGSRGAEVASIADEAKHIETTDRDLLGARTNADLRGLAKEHGLPISGNKATLVERLATRERKVPEHAVFDPKQGAYVAPGSNPVVAAADGLRARIGLDPAKNFKANYQRVTDWVIENGDEAGSIAELKNHPLMRQLDDSGPVLDALDSAKKYGDEAGLDDVALRGLLDDVQLAAMGSAQATTRVSEFSKKLYADMADIEKSLGESRKSVMADPYAAIEDKLAAFDSDPAVKLQIEAAGDMRLAAKKLDSIQNQAEGRGVRVHNALGRGAFAAPGVIARGVDAGLTRALRTFRPAGENGPRVHLMTGIRLPNAMDFGSLNVVEEFNQHADETISVLQRKRLENGKGDLDVPDEHIALLNKFKDDFAKTEDPIGRRDADSLASQRRQIFSNFQVAARDMVEHKLVARVAHKERLAGNPVNVDQVRAETRAWMHNYEAQSKATVDGLHRKRNDLDPAHMAPEYVSLSDNDFVVPHQGLAAALDKAAPTSAHRFRWDDFEDLFTKKFKLGQVFNDITPDMKPVHTVVGEVADEINDHLKWLLLGRPVAYALRNLFEGSQRILATQDTLTAFAAAGHGVGHVVANRGRIAVDHVRLMEAKTNHSIRERRLLEARGQLQELHDLHMENAASLKRLHKPSGAEVNRAAELRTRLEVMDASIADSRVLTDMDIDAWRAHVKENAKRGLKTQIEEFEADLQERRSTIAKIDGLKEPTTSDLHVRDELQDEVDVREAALAEAHKSQAAFDAVHAAEGAKKVTRGNTVLRKTAGYEGGLDTKTGQYIPPSLLNAYDNPMHMRHHETDAFESTNKVIESSTAKWAHRDFRIRDREVTYNPGKPEVAKLWNESYATLVNQRIRKSPGAMRYAASQREDDLLNWATEDPKGIQWARDTSEATGLPVADLVDETIDLVDKMLPTGRHRSIASDRELTPEDVDDMWTEAKAMTPEQAKAKADEARAAGQDEVADLGSQIEDLDARIKDRKATSGKSKRERQYLDRLVEQRKDLVNQKQSRLEVGNSAELTRGVETLDAQRIARPVLKVPERAFKDILGNDKHGRGIASLPGRLDQGRDWYFRHVGAIPEAAFTRHPLYVMKFNTELNKILNAKGVKGSGRRGRATEADATDRLSLAEINKAVETARGRARRHVTDTLYDTSRRTNLQHNLRYISPFFAAWQDSWTKWTKISLDNPVVPYLGYQGYEALPQAFQGAAVVDDDGNFVDSDGHVYKYNALTGERGDLIEGESRNPNEGTILWRVPGKIGDWLEDKAGVKALSIPRGTFNVAFQGENPAIPGFGGFVAMPYNEVVTRSPWAANMSDKLGLADLIAPYGTKKNAGESAMPNWLKDAHDFFSQDDAAGKRAFTELMQAQMNAEATGQVAPMKRDARDKLINGRVGVWQFMNMVGAQSPFSVNMDSKMRAASDLFYDTYASKIGDGPNDYKSFTQAVAVFNQDFPEFANADISITADDTGINASYGAQTAAEQWRTEIAKDPNMARVLIGPTAADGGDYSDAIANYQKTNQIVPGGSTWRGGLTKDNLTNVILVENGKREWSRFNMLLAEAADEAGLEYEDPKMASARKQMRDTYFQENYGEWYSEYTSDSYAKNEIIPTLANAKAAIAANPKAVASTPHLQSLGTYIEGRTQMKAAMDLAGYATSDSQEFLASPLGYEWSSYTSNLLKSDPEFERMYYELGLDADNLQYVIPEVG